MSDPEGRTERLFLTLSATEDAVSRLDEQVRASPLAEGWAARLDFSEAAAWAWSSNELAPLEDLVLHDAQMDVRTVGQGLGRAHGLVQARRRAWRAGPEIVTAGGALWLTGRSPRLPARQDKPPAPAPLAEDRGLVETLDEALKGLAAGVTETPRQALADWREALASVEAAPALLAAAFALEAWRVIAPLPREDHIGPVLTAAWLRDRRRVASHLLGVQGGARLAGAFPSRLEGGPAAARLLYHLEVLRRAALAGSEELRRLSLVRQLLEQQTRGRRKGARAADLAALLLASPVVSAPMAAERLGVSQQAVRALIPTLGSSVRELTGRRRFQAWKV